MYYFILFLNIMFLYILREKKKITFNIGKYNVEKVDLDQLFFSVIILIWIFVFTLKSLEIGTDVRMYEYMYKTAYTYVENKNVFNIGVFNQPLYYYIFWVLSKIMKFPYRTALFLIYSFSLFSIWYFVMKRTENRTFCIFMLMCSGFFWFCMSAIRQTMAISIGLFAIDYLMEKKYIRFFIGVIMSVMIHRTAVILLLILFIVKINDDGKNSAIIIALSSVIAFIIPTNIVSYLVSAFNYTDYEDNVGISSSILMMLVYVAVATFIVVVNYKREKCRNDMVGIYMLFSFMILFSSKFYLLSRVAYYVIVPAYIYITNKISEFCKNDYKLLFDFIIILMILWMVIPLRNNPLNVMPYRFYWKNGEVW